MLEIVIVDAARAPIGKFGGSLAQTPAADLGALIIRKVLERTSVAAEQVSEVIIGQLLTAGVGQNPARTPIGKFGGSLAKTPAADLGALVIRKVLERGGVTAEQVSEAIMGQVLTAGVGQNPARQAAIKAGIPYMVPAMTINKVCGSG